MFVFRFSEYRGGTVKVIVMRHGDAVFQGGDRVLSSRGEQEAKLTGMKLVSHLAITKIISSPKQRAIQTAEIVRSLLRGRQIPQVELLPELSPSGDAHTVFDYVNAIGSPDDTILLVSHIPQVINLSYTFGYRQMEVPMFYTAAAMVLEKVNPEDELFVAKSFYHPNGEKLIHTPSLA